MSAPNLTLRKIQEAFPGAITSKNLASCIRTILQREEEYTNATTLLATSLCSDEVNRKLEGDLTKIYSSRSNYNPNFNMGGLSGFAHGGVTSFVAMAGHIPNGGNVVIVYGPHVGVDREGTVGRVNRRGRPDASNVCCGSADIARKHVLQNNNKKDNTSPPENATDAQQAFVQIMLQPYANELECAHDIDVALPSALFKAQDAFMKDVIIKEVIDKSLLPADFVGKIALLGGIQINTPIPRSRSGGKTEMDDYFLCKTFTILDKMGVELNDHTSLLLNDGGGRGGCGGRGGGRGGGRDRGGGRGRGRGDRRDGGMQGGDKGGETKIADVKTDGEEIYDGEEIADVTTDGEEIDDGEEIADVKNDDGEEIANLIRAFYEERLMCCAPGGIDGIVQ